MPQHRPAMHQEYRVNEDPEAREKDPGAVCPLFPHGHVSFPVTILREFFPARSAPWRKKGTPCFREMVSPRPVLGPTHVGTRAGIDLDDLALLDEEGHLDGLPCLQDRRLHDIP